MQKAPSVPLSPHTGVEAGEGSRPEKSKEWGWPEDTGKAETRRYKDLRTFPETQGTPPDEPDLSHRRKALRLIPSSVLPTSLLDSRPAAAQRCMALAEANWYRKHQVVSMPSTMDPESPHSGGWQGGAALACSCQGYHLPGFYQPFFQIHKH